VAVAVSKYNKSALETAAAVSLLVVRLMEKMEAVELEGGDEARS